MTRFFPELNQSRDLSDCKSVCSASGSMSCSSSSYSHSTRRSSMSSSRSCPGDVSTKYEQLADLKADHARRLSKLMKDHSKKQSNLESALMELMGSSIKPAPQQQAQAQHPEEEPDFDNEELWVEI